MPRQAPLPGRTATRVVRSAEVGGGAYELVLERRGLAFAAGQLITLHGHDATEDRDYSIASGTGDEHLAVLYRHVPNGRLTSRLVLLSEGDAVDMTGPYGQFALRDLSRPVVFIATGTGIAPCRSYARSHPGLDLTVVHGAATGDALHYGSELRGFRYHACVSREEHRGSHHGRVTGFVRQARFAQDSHYYLCGAFEMISEVTEMLEDRGVAPESIFTETYYYGAET